MKDVFAVEAIQNGKRSDVQLFSKLADALHNLQFVKDAGEDDSANLYRTRTSMDYDLITEHIKDFDFQSWDFIGDIIFKEPVRYTSTYWQHEAELSEGREGVYFVQILDPEGEEYAVIIHRTDNGQFPIGGREANDKLERANKICEALNATL